MLREIAFIHPSLNSSGGAERIAIEMLKILKDRGHHVTLHTFDKTNWSHIKQNWCDPCKPDAEFYLQNKTLKITNMLQWIIFALVFIGYLTLNRRKNCLTINNYGEVFPFLSQISWVHSKPLYSCDYRENPFQIPHWRLVQPLFRLIHIGLSKIKSNSLLVANSEYNANLIKKDLGQNPRVIHSFITPTNPADEKKPRQVLTISRLNPTKNLQRITKISLRTPDNHYVLAGNKTPKTSELLRKMYQPPNLEIIFDPTRKMIIDLMGRSTLYLSTLSSEAFGMAVVEAMSAGCIPVVPRSGGPWIDILDKAQGYWGFGYSSNKEAARIIEMLSNDHSLRSSVAQAALERSKRFRLDTFKTEFIHLIESCNIE